MRNSDESDSPVHGEGFVSSISVEQQNLTCPWLRFGEIEFNAQGAGWTGPTHVGLDWHPAHHLGTLL